jgi:hypothetical protein
LVELAATIDYTRGSPYQTTRLPNGTVLTNQHVNRWNETRRPWYAFLGGAIAVLTAAGAFVLADKKS